MSDFIIDKAEWPHGVRCMDCDRLFEDGEAYWEDSTDDDVVELVCLTCAVNRRVTPEEMARGIAALEDDIRAIERGEGWS